MCYISGVKDWTMFFDFVLIAGMSLLFLFAVFLLKSGKGSSKKLLSIFFVNSIFYLLYYYGFLHRPSNLVPIAFLFGSGAGFLLGPTLLFYIRSLVWKKGKIKKPFLKHLSPFFLHWLLIAVPVTVNIAFGVLPRYHDFYVRIAYYLNLSENLFFITYGIISYQQVRKIQKAKAQMYASVASDSLDWILYLIIGLISIAGLDSLFSLYELFFPMIPWNIGTLTAFAFIGLYCFLGYKGMFQSQILLPDFFLEEMNETPDQIPAKPSPSPQTESQSDTMETTRVSTQLSGFSDEEIEALKEQLLQILETKKPYLNDSISLSDLADELGITDKKLSELLNQYLDTNFYNLINDYRVREVKQKLSEEDSKKYTLLSIAYECGFPSKTSFNRVFKQKTGLSPSQYRKEKIDSN